MGKRISIKLSEEEDDEEEKLKIYGKNSMIVYHILVDS